MKDIFVFLDETRSRIKEYMKDKRETQGKGIITQIEEDIKDEYSGVSFRKWAGYTWSLRQDHWYGFIPKTPKELSGILVSSLNGEPFVMRYYPEPIKVEAPTKKGLRIHPKINGVEVCSFIDSAGVFWGRTRHVEYIERNSRYNRNLQLLMDMSGVTEKVEQACRKNDIAIFGVLFGKHLPGGYRRYDVDSGYLAYDVLDMSTDRFLPFKKAKKILRRYSIPYVEDVSYRKIGRLDKDHGGVYLKDYSDGDIKVYLIQNHKPDDAIYEAAITSWTDT